MKYLLFLLLSSCSVPIPIHSQKYKSKHARITYYSGRNEKVAMNGQRAREGITCAASPDIPFGTWLQIPELGDSVSQWLRVEDRGSAVTSRKASHGTAPVIDVFIRSSQRMNYLKNSAQEYMIFNRL